MDCDHGSYFNPFIPINVSQTTLSSVSCLSCHDYRTITTGLPRLVTSAFDLTNRRPLKKNLDHIPLQNKHTNGAMKRSLAQLFELWYWYVMSAPARRTTHDHSGQHLEAPIPTFIGTATLLRYLLANSVQAMLLRFYSILLTSDIPSESADHTAGVQYSLAVPAAHMGISWS